jgi:pimeloyl-ACP methyl ester carboxylesterase
MRWLSVICCNSFAFFISAIYCHAQQSDTMFYKNINGLSVAYWQTGHGPALVLLHGFGIDSRVWRQQIESLSSKFTIIAWDAPGAGYSSDPPPSFGLIDWATCLASLLDSIGIKRAHFLGLSWGGILAQQFYRQYSARVLSLILADTYAGWKGSLPPLAVDERLATCLHDASLTPADFVAKYLPSMFSDSVKGAVKEELANIMADFHPMGFKLMATSSARTDSREILSSIKVPTLLIWGGEDRRSPLTVAKQFQEKIRGAILTVIPKVGHVSNMEDPAQFNKIVTDFCLSVRN